MNNEFYRRMNKQNVKHLNEDSIPKDGGIGSFQKMKKIAWRQFLLIKLENAKS